MRSSYSWNSWRNNRSDHYSYSDDGRILGELSDGKYNLILGAVLFWGFFVNAIICLFFADAVLALPPQILLAGYVVLAIIGVLMSVFSANPIVSFIGYNLVVLPLGAVLTVLVTSFDPDIVLLTMLVTSIVVLGLTILSALFPRLFLSLGPVLGITLFLTLIANLICALFGLAPAWLDFVVTLIFCGYIGFDYAHAQSKMKTIDNAIDSACELYVDIVNLFIRILSIMSRSSKRR